MGITWEKPVSSRGMVVTARSTDDSAVTKSIEAAVFTHEIRGKMDAMEFMATLLDKFWARVNEVRGA